MKTTTQCPGIDDLLEGGLEPGAITLVYGEPASGKTNLCLQAARSVVGQGLRVAYVDTEGVSFDRLKQVGGADHKRMMEQVLFSSPHTFAEQTKAVNKAVDLEGVGLIVVDSLNFYYRLELDADTAAASRALLAQLGTLANSARKNRIPVLVTAQVYGSDEEVLPFGGRLMGHIVKTVIEFKRDTETEGIRRAILRKHRAIPDGRSAVFRITERGLE